MCKNSFKQELSERTTYNCLGQTSQQAKNKKCVVKYKKNNDKL